MAAMNDHNCRLWQSKVKQLALKLGSHAIVTRQHLAVDNEGRQLYDEILVIDGRICPSLRPQMTEGEQEEALRRHLGL